MTNKPKKRAPHLFQPGQSGNPGGAKKLPQEIKDARNANKQKFELGLAKYIDCNITELNKAMKDPKTPAIDLIVISALTYAIKKGDSRARDFIIERAIGKVKTELEVSSPTGHSAMLAYIQKKNGE